MGELTEANFDDIRAFVENESGSHPALEDLVARWDSISPDARAPDAPSYLARDMLIWTYVGWASTKRWAWLGLNGLLIVLQERNEPLPTPLTDWACTVVSERFQGTLKVPAKPRNPVFAPKDDRDARIQRVYLILRKRMGWTHENAIGDIARACDLKEDTVGSVLKKMRREHPYKRATKSAA